MSIGVQDPSSGPSVELWFALSDTLRLAEDAATATDRRTRWEPGPTLEHPGHEVDAGPALMLVRDEGVYLMSTNRAAAQDGNGSLPHTYARGFAPGNGQWRNAWNATGMPGDDFAEYLEVVESALLTDIRRACADGYRWFVVTLTPDQISLAFDRGVTSSGASEAGS
jgi:hypothetical protein